MEIAPLRPDLEQYLRKRNLAKKFAKQKLLFCANPFHTGLRTELLEPKALRFWSFRIDKKYRAIFIFARQDKVEIIDINDHYQ